MGVLSGGHKRAVSEVYLGGPRPEPRKRSRLMIVGLVVRRLRNCRLLIQCGGMVQARLTIFEVHIGSKVHFRSTCLEDQTSFSPRWEWEFNLPIQSTRPQQSRVEGIGTICGHDDLRTMKSEDAYNRFRKIKVTLTLLPWSKPSI